MNAGLPIAISRSVATSAELDDVFLRDERAVVIGERVAVLGVVAVETEAIGTVVELDVLVFDKLGVMPLGFDQLVAVHAVVGPAHAGQVQALGFPNGFLVEMSVLGQAGLRLFCQRLFHDRQLGLDLGDDVAAGRLRIGGE